MIFEAAVQMSVLEGFTSKAGVGTTMLVPGNGGGGGSEGYMMMSIAEEGEKMELAGQLTGDQTGDYSLKRTHKCVTLILKI